MALIEDYTSNVIAANTVHLMDDGKRPSQAVAISYRVARRAWKREHPNAPLPEHLQRPNSRSLAVQR